MATFTALPCVFSTWKSHPLWTTKKRMVPFPVCLIPAIAVTSVFTQPAVVILSVL